MNVWIYVKLFLKSVHWNNSLFCSLWWYLCELVRSSKENRYSCIVRQWRESIRQAGRRNKSENRKWGNYSVERAAQVNCPDCIHGSCCRQGNVDKILGLKPMKRIVNYRVFYFSLSLPYYYRLLFFPFTDISCLNTINEEKSSSSLVVKTTWPWYLHELRIELKINKQIIKLFFSSYDKFSTKKVGTQKWRDRDGLLVYYA